MTDDAELLRRYAEEKSEDAFAELVRRHLDLVYAVALRKVGGDAHLAEDVAQQVFASLATKASTLRRHPTLAGWLFASTHYAASRLVRAERRRRLREQKAQTMNELLQESGPAVDWEALRPVLDDLICELGERDREAVVLRFFEGRSLAEVGVKLRLSEEGARSRVNRTLDKLRGSLAQRGVTSTFAALSVALASQAGAAAPAGLAASVTGAALASATTGAGATALATVFTTMNTIKTAVVATGVIVTFVTGAASYEAVRGRQMKTALAALTHEADEFRSRLRLSERELREAIAREKNAESNVADLRKEIERFQNTRGAAGPTKPVVNPDEMIRRLAANNPELRKLHVQNTTVRFKVRYGPLYRTLGFTSGQIGEFERIRADNVQAQSDIVSEAVRQGLAATDPIVQELVKQADKRQEGSLRALLGQEALQQYQTYEITLPLRGVANTLADSLYFTDTPLTHPQAEQLTQIVAQSLGQPTAAGSLGAIKWDAVLAKAPTVLSPVQVEALATLVEQTRIGSKVNAIQEAALKDPAPAASGGR